jgi:hypothetical protein
MVYVGLLCSETVKIKENNYLASKEKLATNTQKEQNYTLIVGNFLIISE